MNVYLLLIILSLLAIHIFVRYRRFGQMIDKIPGPVALPFFGTLWKLIGSAEHLWYALHEMVDQHYPIAKIWLPTTAMILIRHPDDLEIMLSSKKHTEKGSIYDLLRSWIQDGVIMSKGEKWQKRRKLIVSSFHMDNLKKSIEVTNQYGNEMIEAIKSHGQVSNQDVSTLFIKPFLYAFCDASLDTDLRKFNDDLIDDYKKGVFELFGVGIYRVVRPYIMDWMMPFLSVGKKEKDNLQRVFKFRDEVINKRRQYHNQTRYRFLTKTTDINEEILGEHKRKLSLLDQLLLTEREGRINEKGINEEMDTMMVTGHDTEAATMTFVIMLLAENEKAQELARKETSEMFDKANGKITMTEVNKLEYLDRCIKEALRLYPTAPLFLRYLQGDLPLKNYTIPAGADVMCMIFATHRDPKFWPNPDKFDPDRFAPHLVEKRHPYAYVPFSAGIRNCLGQKHAMIQMKVLLANILYNFYLEPIDLTKNLRFNASITLHPNKPVYTKFIAINR